MNLKELVDTVHSKVESKVTKTQVKEILQTLTETIREKVKEGEDVKLTGFGRFYLQHRAGRTGRNPMTGESLEIPPKDVPKFKVSKKFFD